MDPIEQRVCFNKPAIAGLVQFPMPWLFYQHRSLLPVDGLMWTFNTRPPGSCIDLGDLNDRCGKE